jgi:Zn finger protein HypA/HybF involved in hydrogenase expression
VQVLVKKVVEALLKVARKLSVSEVGAVQLVGEFALINSDLND